MNDDTMVEFGKWLSNKRHIQGISIREAAKKIGIEPSYYCKIENGQRNDLRLSTIEKVAKVFPINDFILERFSYSTIDKNTDK
jgi:transcriptional regulator with XRE-family HTH domain